MGHGYRWIGMSEDRNSVLIKRYQGEFTPKETQESLFDLGERRIGVVLDVETTGMNSATDHVIEIGIRRFSYSPQTGEVFDRLEGYGELQDPGIPIPELITKLTGITDDMVRGKSIDWAKVDSWIAEADLVIAHNAGFDRPFIEKHCSAATKALWGCSVKEIDWTAKGFPTAKLEILSIFHGFFVDAHRALEDSDALLHLLTFPDPHTGDGYLKELIQSSQCKWFRVMAKRSAFEKKDVLKSRRYRWEQNQKFWYRDVAEAEIESEKGWLLENVYTGAFLGEIKELSSSQRFKE